MGWFAMVSDKKDKKLWEKEARKILVKCKQDDILYLYDLHI